MSTQTKAKGPSTSKKSGKERKRKPRNRDSAAVIAEVNRIRVENKTTDDARRAVLTAKKLIKSRARPGKSCLADWAASLSDPFGKQGITCPVNFNPTPSLLSTTATTQASLMQQAVQAGGTTQIMLFPGHGAPPPSMALLDPAAPIVLDTMDGVAYHSLGLILLNGLSYVVGPINTFNSGGLGEAAGVAGGVFSTNLANTVSTSSTASTNIPWDRPLPYKANAIGSGHIRWQLVSMGVRIFNTTPEINRGGNIFTVQFVNGAGPVTVAGAPASLIQQLSFNPSYKMYDAIKPLEISWIPRMQDLAYWHALRVPPGSSVVPERQVDFAAAGMGIWLTAPAGYAQTYDVEIVCNWMLAGNLLAGVSSEAPNHPVAKPAAEELVVNLQNHSSTAGVASKLVNLASTGVHDAGQMVAKMAEKGFQAVIENAHKVI